MIDKYLEHLHEDDEHLNEFVILPIIIIAHKIYKKHLEHKKIAMNCIGVLGVDRKKCFIKYKIDALTKAITELKSFTGSCKKNPKTASKCIAKINKELSKMKREIQTLKTKLAKLG